MQGNGKSAGTRSDRGLARTGLEVAIYCSLLAAMVFVPSVAQAQTDAERAALVALYDATDGDNWTENANWKSEEPVGDWDGVTVENGVVTKLYLWQNSLSGEIPSEIGNLTRLVLLDLAFNSLSGAIPSEIGNLTSLGRLSLQGNQLSGTIPAEIWNLTSLALLRLDYNNLSGEIPAEIWNLTSLEELGLGDNSLSGEIPSEIGNLTNLGWLSLNINQFNGEIPAEIWNLTSLTQLYLDGNQLSGAIPSEIGNLISLGVLGLADNALSGSIPSEIGNLTSLEKLYLYNNQLSGSIPSEIGNLTNLGWLSLSSNQFNGEIPSEIGNLTSLEVLDLDDNALSGEIPSEIANLTSLEWLDLSYNTELTGELSAGLRLLPVTTLDIRNTCITTPADSDFQAWLAGITFYDTDRVCAAGVTVTPTTLSVPEGSNAKYTVVLDAQPSANVTISVSLAAGSDADITVNKISLTFTTGNWDAAQEVTVSAAQDDDAINGSATIEHSASGGGYSSVSVSSVVATEEDNDADAERAALVAIYDATDGDNWTDNTNWKTEEPVADWYGVTVENGVVTKLELEDNNLTGTLPSEIGNLTRLGVLTLQSNSLSGEIPEEIGNLTSLWSLDIAGNSLSGEIPSEIANLTSLMFLTLSFNSLSGSIPSEIWNLTRLELLNLGSNSLSGSIPSEIGNLTRLDILGLSDNSLSGSIPSEIGNLTSLELLNLGSNSLSGSIPSEIGNLTSLELLNLGSNSLSGSIPSEIGNLTSLERLILNDNTELTGELPAGLRLLPINYLDIRETCITTPADSNFQTWLAGIAFFDTDRVCAAGVTVTPTALSVPEGSNAKYTVVLDAQPSADVTIAVSLAAGSDTDITVNKTSLTFTTENWDTAQEVTVSAAEDTDTANGAATIEHSASGGGYGGVTVSSVTVTEADNDNDADAERAALVAIYDATDGDNWTDNTNWKSEEPVGNWYGVTVENGAVTELDLEDNNLTGTLPPEIGNLTSLEVLRLGFNSLSGAIPSAMGDLTSLEGLWLYHNQLSGSIPPAIGDLTSLEELWLNGNQLSGEIPSEIGNLTSLEKLHLSRNQLSGSIPSEIGNLTSLKELWLAANALSDSIPSEIGNLTRLEELHLSSNSLSGSIPSEIGNLTRLELLNLGSNSLSGSIPSEIGDLTSLEQLWLSTNNLSGAIPSEIWDLTSLEYLGLSNNSLSGAIPSEIWDLTSLEQLWLSTNNLSGAIPSEIWDLTSLEVLFLGNNQLSGAIPAEIGNLTRLERLGLDGNALTGEIPSEIGNLTSLQWLSLDRNNLTGAIPSEIANLTRLELLILRDNTELTGELPAGLRLLPLVELDIRNTCITTPADSDFQAWLAGIRFFDTDRVCAAGVTVTPTTLSVPEGSNVKYTVVLDTEPSADVTISLSFASGSDTDITVDKTSLTFTPDNWNAAQEVTVSAAEDDDATDGAATIEHSASGGDYGGVSVSSVTATEADNDTAGIGVTVTPTTLSVPEGSNAKYTVVLDTQPSADVTISLSFASGSDEDITADKTSLTFTTDNWDATQEVTVSAAEDDDATDGAAAIEHSASGGGYGGVTVSSVTATEADNDKDAVGVTVTPTTLSVPEGSNAKYTVVLDTQPSADVTIAVSLASGSDADITVDKISLTFTTDNWDTSQEVTVSAAEDDDALNGVATIEHSASGGGYDNVSASSVTATEADNDNDTAGVTVTPTALTVPEGSNAKYTVALDAQPSADVTISLSFASGSDEDITVDKTSLTFTPENWDAAQEITVLAAEDDDAINGAATIAHTVSGGGYGGVTVSSVTATEADNDTAGVTVTPTALTVPEGSNAKYTVALDARPSADVTISVSLAAGSDEDITVDKTSLTFTTDNWDAAQEITVLAEEDDDALNGVATIEHSVSGADYGNVSVSSVTATEADNDTAGVTVTPTALTVTEGSNAKYTVVLDTQPSDDVTIAVSFASGSDEDITVDKTSLTFTTDNWSAVQEVTVSAAVDNDIDDDAAVLNHRASGGDYGEVTIADVVVTVTDVIGGVDVSAWLARYSRVGADHLLSSVENRMESIDRGASGAEASIAGQRIVFGDSPARPGMELSGASAIWSASQSYTTSSPRGGRSVGLMKPFGMNSGLNAAARRYTNMTLRDALSRSAFRYAREMSSGNSFGVWGQGSFSRFSGSESGADMDGDVMSGTVGIDNRFSGWLHGIAVSRSESEGAYRIAGEDSLSLSASLTGIYPYMRYNLTDRLRVWGTGGYGRGSLRLQGDSLASSSSDLSMMLGSIGVSGDIVSAGSQGFGLSWQTDAMLLRSSLASSRSLSSVEAIVHRLRLSLESSYTLRMGDRASLAPKLQLGVRRDGGDAEQGMGLDVAAGLGFVNSAWGLRAQVDMHGMLVHEDSDFEQWGVSGMILFDRSPSLDIGASLRLFPSWGSASSSTGGMRALWSRETVSGLAGFRRTGGDDRSLRLAGRFDYGFAAFGKGGVTTPYASFSLSGNEARGAVADTGVELGGGLGYSNRSLGLRMRAGMRGLMSEEEVGFEQWGASGTIAFDPDPSSPLGASFNVSQSWGITPRTGFGGSQNMGTMREREPLPRSVTGMSRPNLYGQPMRIEGEMGYGFSSSGGKGVATPYAGVAFSDRDRSGLLLGFNLQAGRRFLLNVEGSTPKVRAISFDSMPEFRVRGLLKW